MNSSQLIKLLKNLIPENMSYGHIENYGDYNCDNLTEVKRVLYCVTPTRKVQQYFLENKYDLLISHHPYVAQSNIPQLIFHTALDCCHGGLNDIMADYLGVKGIPFDENLGVYGELPTKMSLRDLTRKIELLVGGEIKGQIYKENPDEKIGTVCICTGLGGLVTEIAFRNTNADCYITGELISPAEKIGFESCIEIGHTLSERIGVNFFRKALEPFDVVVDCAPMDIDRFGGEVFGGKQI